MEHLMHHSRVPRGIRNNNPGNIKDTDQFQWFDQTGADADGYCKFKTPAAGIRAMVVNLHSYYFRDHLETIADIITQWAPPGRNDTDDYIKDVVVRTGIPALVKLRFWADCRSVVTAIIWHENGMQPYGEETITKGITSARVR